MIEVKIPQEISQYEAKMVGPFTMRQAICGLAAIVASWTLRAHLGNILSQDALISLIVLVCIPLGLIGWIKPYGMRFELFFAGVLFNTLISNSKRFFRSADIIAKINAIHSGTDTTKKMEGDSVKRHRQESPDKIRSRYKKHTYA